MTRVTAIQRLAAAAIAVLVTASTVLGMSTWGDPPSKPAQCAGS